MGNKQKIDELDVLQSDSQGVKISLGEDEWITFRRDGWTFPDRLEWGEANARRSMELIIEWTVDWRLKDVNGALIPFAKEELLGDLKRVNIDYYKTALMARAVFVVFNEVSALPLA